MSGMLLTPCHLGDPMQVSPTNATSKAKAGEGRKRKENKVREVWRLGSQLKSRNFCINLGILRRPRRGQHSCRLWRTRMLCNLWPIGSEILHELKNLTETNRGDVIVLLVSR